MRGIVKGTKEGQILLAINDDTRTIVLTDKSFAVGEEAYFPAVEQVDCNEKGIPIYKNKEAKIFDVESETEKLVNKREFSRDDLILAALEILLCKELDVDIEEVRFLVAAAAAKNLELESND